MKQRKQKTIPRPKSRGKSTHVLAVILKTLGCSQKCHCESVFGYSRWTIKSIILGKLDFSSRAVKIISERTNVAPEWLVAGNGNVPPVTRQGKPFTLESYLQYLNDVEKKQEQSFAKQPSQAAGLFPFLTIRAARLMIAAVAHDKTVETFWKLREYMNLLGAKFPEFAKDGHAFEMSLVMQFHNPEVEQSTLWGKIINSFHEQLNAAVKKQAAVAAAKSKTTTKPCR